MTTAYKLLPALVAEHPGRQPGAYARMLGLTDRVVQKALAKLEEDGCLVRVPERKGGRQFWYTADDVDLPPAVHLRTSSWESVRVPPGPRSVFDLAAGAPL